LEGERLDVPGPYRLMDESRQYGMDGEQSNGTASPEKAQKRS